MPSTTSSITSTPPSPRMPHAWPIPGPLPVFATPR
jgi:hypothetical protein